MVNNKVKILIYGYGNPGRMDDGLGAAFVENMQKWVEMKGYDNIDFDCNYQLNIEDAYEIAERDIAIFVDASMEAIDDFKFEKVNVNTKVSYTTHEASPGYIYHLSKELFGKSPATFLMHIKGYKWDFQQGLSPKAKENLQKALEFMKNKCENWEM